MTSTTVARGRGRGVRDVVSHRGGCLYPTRLLPYIAAVLPAVPTVYFPTRPPPGACRAGVPAAFLYPAHDVMWRRPGAAISFLPLVRELGDLQYMLMDLLVFLDCGATCRPPTFSAPIIRALPGVTAAMQAFCSFFYRCTTYAGVPIRFHLQFLWWYGRRG